ncbi:MAG: DUF4982 domain-containing protein [Dysgonamonadaceae bacterium]|jgi:hypothetical protein|nr:DUF4982 domain-containing protein [Dysgonamonadaceae bacterium]
MKYKLFILFCLIGNALSAQKAVPEKVMQKIYEEVKTPYKYGLVIAPSDNRHKMDCPTVFRKNGKWYMSYLVYDGKSGKDGRGYETWLAESDDLLHWNTLDRVLSFPGKNSGRWDENQRAGYIALIDYQWNGTYEPQKFNNNYWMSYFGGKGQGYEQGMLHEGIAFTSGDITTAHEWQTPDKPILSPLDSDKGWWESITQYKSSVIWDKKKTLGYPFILYYNAGGVNPANNVKAERIGIALSDDMLHWTRYKGNPVVNHEQGITGDGVIQQIGDVYVMFYFGAFHKNRPYKAFNTFACSYDLVNWTDWNGEDLIFPTEKYDNLFAHKSCVVKWNGVVYHFYCAVNENDQRGIAIATSKNMSKSLVRFPKPDKETFRTEMSLNSHWETTCTTVATRLIASLQSDTTAAWQSIDIPHNWDKYEGARRLKHGNRHGTALYRKTFHIDNHGEGKRYFLFFEGVGSYATVYLNEKPVGYHAGGRTTFTLDITDFIDFKQENKLFVIAEHPPMIVDLPWVCGGCSSEWGFSEGSQPMGIFRPVTLIVSNDVRVEPFGVHAWNPAPAFQGKDTVFTLNVNTEIKNYSHTERRLEIIQKLTDKDGRQIERISDTIRLKPNEIKTVLQQSKPLFQLHLWNTAAPYLYKLITMIKENGQVIDQETTPYGFRWISWPQSRNDDDNRFYLNGKPVFINGVCEYEHLLGNSHAFTEEQILSRVNQIKAAGFNAFRDAHQPHNLLYGQQWNQSGILWWTQFSAHIWYDTPEFRKNFKNNLREWVKERRSNPSVILWGLQNESVLPEEFARECTEIIRGMDPTSPSQRLVTTCNGGTGTDWNVVQNWSGTYGGNPANYAQELSRPEQLLNGEYGAWRSIDLHTDNADGKITDKHTETYMCNLLEQKIHLAEQARDSVCGQFQWIYSSHDNPGRIQNEEGIRDIDRIGPFNYKGLVTPWEEPTDAYYLYRANYVPAKQEPMVYIVSHTWPDRWQEPGIKNGIVAYSNCDEVELFNDVKSLSLGKRTRNGTGTHFQWDNADIRYNVLYAVGYVDGKAVANDVIVMNHLPESPNVALLYGPTIETRLIASLQQKPAALNYIYRISCGGENYTDSNGNLWLADVPKAEGNYWGSTSWSDEWKYLPWNLASQRQTCDPIAGTHDWPLFQTFRYGRDKLKYHFPLPDGEYLVDLYFIEPWWGTGGGMDCEGFRVFDVAVSGDTVLKNLDIWKEAGHDQLLKKTVQGCARNGLLEVSFPRIIAGQAIISAIAVASEKEGIQAAPSSPASVSQTNVPEEPEARPATTYANFLVENNSVSWEISPGLAGIYALRFKYMNPSGASVNARIKILSSDKRIMRDDTIQFPPTPGKWRILNTTTGAYINAGKYRVIISGKNSNDLKFDILEMQ